MTPEELFLAQLPLIERVIASACRRHRCLGPEAEDFAQMVKMKLIEDDYAVLRQFKGDAKLRTYLTVVVHRSYLDYQIQRWGKWRPSACAKRFGQVAEHLDTLWNRDGRSLDEAIETLLVNDKVDLTREDLEEIAAELPRHPPRRFEGEEALRRYGSSDGVESRVLDRDRAAQVQRTEECLTEALKEFSEEDRLILKLFFYQGMTKAAIARALHLNQRQLYTQFERYMATLRQALEAAGITAEEVAEILGWERSRLRVGLRDPEDPESSE